MTREEKQKAINALKISAPVVVVTQEEFKDYIQTLNKIMDWLEQEPTTKNDKVDCKHTYCKNCVNHKYCDYESNCSEIPTGSTPKNDLGVDVAVVSFGDAISRQEAINTIRQLYLDLATQKAVIDILKILPPVTPQEPKTGHYEKHIDHTDCIWYGSDSGCPVTCSQYRDGWNDAMDYIFKNGKGYQPYRHDG